MRRAGTSFAHPLIVLVADPNGLPVSRFGVAAGRSLGNAVDRNRARRRLREALRPLIPYILTGWDLLFLARRPMQQASFQDLQKAVLNVLQRAGLLTQNPFSTSS